MGHTASALQDDDNTSLNNIQFYTNQISSKPDGGKIDEVLKNWFGDWDKLEVHHGYVQWLFPIREGGLNFSAQPLSKHESSVFRQSPDILKRCVKSYELMLDFYGMVLVDRKTGAIARNPKTFKNRYAHLNNSFHNYLRITRICKFLGIIGLEHYKKEFLRHLIIEVYKHELLSNADESCIRYWMPTLRKKEDLQELDDLVSAILQQKVNRAKLGYGDEDGVNWATQLYPAEVVLPDDDLQPAMEPVPADATTTTTTTTTIDVATYHYDPYSAIHKKFESTAKKNDFMSWRMNAGQMNNSQSNSQVRRVQIKDYSDDAEDSDDGGDGPAMEYRGNTATGQKVYKRPVSDDEDSDDDDQSNAARASKQPKLTITNANYQAAQRNNSNKDSDEDNDDLQGKRNAVQNL